MISVANWGWRVKSMVVIYMHIYIIVFSINCFSSDLWNWENSDWCYFPNCKYSFKYSWIFCWKRKYSSGRWVGSFEESWKNSKRYKSFLQRCSYGVYRFSDQLTLYARDFMAGLVILLGISSRSVWISDATDQVACTHCLPQLFNTFIVIIIIKRLLLILTNNTTIYVKDSNDKRISIKTHLWRK